MNTVLRGIDRLIGRIVSIAKWLALPLIVLLFLQWPLREFVHAYSREANDLGQWLFALYVAIAITAATRAHTHLATDVIARGYSERTRDILARAGALIGMLPWALFVLIAGKNIVISSVLGLEAFPDTANPGYFIVKIALLLLAGLMFVQALIDVFASRGRSST